VTEQAAAVSWRHVGVTSVLVFLIAFVGYGTACAVWLNDVRSPYVSILGSGNRLSVLVVDGPARLVIASGDDPIGFENALTRVLPLFARRVDVLLVAGSGDTLLVPLSAHDDHHVRMTSSLAPLPSSPEVAEFGAISALPGPRRISLGTSVTVTVETQHLFGADSSTDFPAWRAIVEHGQTRIVVLSDGAAAALFPPVNPASVLVVTGADPVEGWNLSPTPALITNGGAISGPDLRSTFSESGKSPDWGFLVFPGEALRLNFVSGGVEIPSESAHLLGVTGDRQRGRGLPVVGGGL
jgi:hypothetical protein